MLFALKRRLLEQSAICNRACGPNDTARKGLPGRDCRAESEARREKPGTFCLGCLCSGPAPGRASAWHFRQKVPGAFIFFFYFWFCFKCLFRAVCGCLQARSQKQSSREGYTAGAFTAGWGGPHYGSSVAVLTLTRPSGKGMFSCSGLSAASASASVASCHSPTL